MHLGAKDNSFQYMRELHCRHSGAAHIHTYTHTHYVWALTTLENGTSDTFSLIAWTIDLLNNILWEGRLLQRPKQLKIINQS